MVRREQPADAAVRRLDACGPGLDESQQRELVHVRVALARSGCGPGGDLRLDQLAQLGHRAGLRRGEAAAAVVGSAGEGLVGVRSGALVAGGREQLLHGGAYAVGVVIVLGPLYGLIAQVRFILGKNHFGHLLCKYDRWGGKKND
eukprot:scaffold32784_cov69-Phaeocystis_antarctica.AAC.4